MEKPLHVLVAEALGWKIGNFAAGQWWGLEPPDHQAGWPIPRYDTDWSATGPLIERYWIHVFKSLRGWHAAQDASWITLGIAEPPHETPLLAVCHLILALHAAGNLAASEDEPEHTRAEALRRAVEAGDGWYRQR